MIKRVYFDRNVLDRIKRQLLVEDHNYLLLRNAVKRGQFIAPLSITQLEETLPIVKVASGVKGILEQQVMTELLNWDWLIKPHTELLGDDVRSYARGEAVSFPFLSLALAPKEFFNPTGEGRKKILRIIDDTKAQIEEQFQGVKE